MLINATVSAALTGDLSATITQSFGLVDGSGNPIAPAGVRYELSSVTGADATSPVGSGLYDAAKHEVLAEWNFNDTSTANTAANLVTGFADTNIGQGHFVAHAYESAGSYTPAVSLSEGIKTGSVADAVTVTAADTYFHGTTASDPQTICLSVDNNFTSAPANSQNVTSVAAAQTAINTEVTAGRKFRLMFRKGERYSPVNLTASTAFIGALVSTYGTGARPILEQGANDLNGLTSKTELLYITSAMTSFEGITIEGIEFEGGWDVTTETGIQGGRPLDFDAAAGVFHTHDCKMRGLQNVFANMSTSATDAHLVITNCDLGDWYQPGGTVNTGSGCTMAMVGTNWSQSSDACNGLYGRTGTDEYLAGICNAKNWSQTSGGTGWGLRVEQLGKLYIGNSSMFTNLSYLRTYAGGAQPNLRFNTKALNGAELNVFRSTFEGGSEITNFENSSGGLVPEINSTVRECLFSATTGTGIVCDQEHGGATWENIVVFWPNNALQSSRGARDCWKLGSATGDAERLAAPNVYRGITSIYQGTEVTGKNPSILLDDGDGYDFTVEDVIAYSGGGTYNKTYPASADTSGLNLATNMGGFVSKFKGNRAGSPCVSHAEGSTIGDAASFIIAYPSTRLLSGDTANQTNWTAQAGTKHIVAFDSVEGNRWYARSDANEVTVSFDASVITITNNTGETMPAADIRIKLDQSPTTDATFANPVSIPLPQIITASLASFAGASATPPKYDFAGVTRVNDVRGGVDTDV